MEKTAVVVVVLICALIVVKAVLNFLNGCIHDWDFHRGYTLIFWTCKKCNKKITKTIMEEPPL